jgi:hypothetical protein
LVKHAQPVFALKAVHQLGDVGRVHRGQGLAHGWRILAQNLQHVSSEQVAEMHW